MLVSLSMAALRHVLLEHSYLKACVAQAQQQVSSDYVESCSHLQ